MDNLYDNSKYVQELKPSDFQKVNGKTYMVNPEFKGKAMLIKFYAPWCGHCHKLAPVLNKLSKKIGNTKIVVSALNCDKYDISDKLNIQGYPTIFLVKRSTGHLIENKGRNDLDSLIQEIKKLYNIR